MIVHFEILEGEVLNTLKEIGTFTNKLGGWLQTANADLKSNVATEIAALIPGGGQVLTDAEALVDEAITVCNAISGIANNSSAIAGILQRLGTDLSNLIHANSGHSISWFVMAFEAVYNDLFGTKTA